MLQDIHVTELDGAEKALDAALPWVRRTAGCWGFCWRDINRLLVPLLRYALEAASFRVLTLGYSCFRTYAWTKAPAVRVVARKVEGSVCPGNAGCGAKSELAMLRDIQKGRLSGLLESFASLPLG